MGGLDDGGVCGDCSYPEVGADCCCRGARILGCRSGSCSPCRRVDELEVPGVSIVGMCGRKGTSRVAQRAGSGEEEPTGCGRVATLKRAMLSYGVRRHTSSRRGQGARRVRGWRIDGLEEREEEKESADSKEKDAWECGPSVGLLHVQQSNVHLDGGKRIQIIYLLV